MSRKKCQINEKSLGGRLRLFRESKNMRVVQFSLLIGISHGSLSDIENNKSKPSNTPIDGLVRNTDINIYWLFTGKGKMTRKAEQKVCCVVESSPIYNKEGNNDKDPETADLLTRAVKILKSKTEYSDSLAANIKSFHRAIQTEERLGSIDEEIKKIKKSLKQSDNIRKADQENHRGEILKKRKM